MSCCASAFASSKAIFSKPPPYGMWSLHHDDNRSYRGGPALFWEIYERNPESGTILQVLTDALDGGKVLYRRLAPPTLRPCTRTGVRPTGRARSS